MWEHLVQLNKQGVAILLTTQMMEEADRLCQSIAIIDHGQIVAEGSPRSLKAEVGGDVVHIALDTTSKDPDGALAKKAEELVQGRSYVDQVNSMDSGIAITVRDGSAAIPDPCTASAREPYSCCQPLGVQSHTGRRVPQIYRPNDPVRGGLGR